MAVYVPSVASPTKHEKRCLRSQGGDGNSKTQDSRILQHQDTNVWQPQMAQVARQDKERGRKNSAEKGGGLGGVGGGDVVEAVGGEGPPAMTLRGLPLAVLPHEQLPDAASDKREQVRLMREAEKEMGKSRMQLKQQVPERPAAKAAATSSKPDVMTKDEFSFTRAYGTMGLALLSQMDRVHQERKAKEARAEKVRLVAGVRRERVMKREKIEAFQSYLREKAQAWKCKEEGRMERGREASHKEREAELTGQRQRREAGQESARREREGRELSDYFRQNSTLIGNTLRNEDRKASLGESSAAVRAKVRRAKEETQEQQEEVRRFMEQRRSKLWEEGRQERKQVDTKMLEKASQDLLEGKQRVAKEIARKETARAAIAMAKEETRAGPHHADSSRGPAVIQATSCTSSLEALDTISKRASSHKMALLKRQKHRTKQQQQQQQQQQQSVRQYHTWQRGAEAVELNKQFPSLHHAGGGGLEAELSPLMYQMMVPRPPMRASLDTPFTELQSSTSSLHSKTRLHIPTN